MGNEWRMAGDLPRVSFFRNKAAADWLAETTGDEVVRVGHDLWAVRPKK